MSDYTPEPHGYDPFKGPNKGPDKDPNKGYDQYGNAPYELAVDNGKGPYFLLGLLAMIGVIGGLMYFNGAPKDGGNTARVPTAIHQQ